jgi:hypothetical protein
MGYVPNELLSRLTGRNLNSVVFLKWYLQLTFDGPYLNCDVWPKVNVAAESIWGLWTAGAGGRDPIPA